MQPLKRKKQTALADISDYHAALPTVLQTRYNDWPILHWRTVATIVLHHEVHRQTQFSTSMPWHCLAKCAIDNLRVVDDASNIVSAAHKAPVLARLTVHVLSKDLHHILLGIRRLVVAAMAVLWYIQRPIVVQ